MINILIRTESHFTVNRQRIRKIIEDILMKKGVKGDTEISLNIVGDRMMKNLNRKYRKINDTTDVLSFCLTETTDIGFVEPPDGVLHLGDIIISFPQARDEAGEENKLVDDKIDELVEHGMLHLLGQHHE